MQEQRPSGREDMLTDIVVGMSDGLTVPFALTAGLAGVAVSNDTIIGFGLAGVVLGAAAMGIGGYLANKGEIDQGPEDVARMEFGPETHHAVASEIMKDNEGWKSFVADHNLYASDERVAKRSALNISLFYLLGGLIPVLPYFFIADVRQGVVISSIITVICLGGFGFFKAVVTGQPRFFTAFRSTFLGAATATAAYFIGTLFQ